MIARRRIAGWLWLLGAALVLSARIAASINLSPLSEESTLPLAGPATTVEALITNLRDMHEIPICFVRCSVAPGKLHLTFKSGPLRELLAEVQSQAPEYAWRIVDERLLIFPARPEYDYVVAGVAIKNQPRLDAADQLIALLNARYPEFAELLAPPMLGSPQHPTYAERVTLAESGKVIELLAQLLGADRTLFFSIVPARTGLPILVLDRLPQE